MASNDTEDLVPADSNRSSIPYIRLEYRVIFHYHIAMLAMSIILTLKLRYFHERIPPDKVSVVVNLRQFIIENTNMAVIFFLSPFLIKQAISPINQYVAILLNHLSYWNAMTATYTIFIVYIIKELLVKAPGYIESFHLENLSRWLKGVAITFNLLTVCPSFIYCLIQVSERQTAYPVVAFWCDMPLDRNSSINNLAILSGFNFCLGISGVMVDLCVNRNTSLLRMKRLRSWVVLLGVYTAVIISGKFTEREVAFPITGLLFPIFAICMLLNFTEDSYLKDLEYQEEQNGEKIDRESSVRRSIRIQQAAGRPQPTEMEMKEVHKRTAEGRTLPKPKPEGQAVHKGQGHNA